ncbi:MmcQ/YjbR family DNA-binding protein [Vibrio furnissii]|uniref:MmcQ/YjbR family DNA-binding protein n=1 Tax=Vibrio furnissii TaxID=29494 RepID=UPI00155933E6|nr:MmcQ/YjbR family DNA-binding protein [Vibrio furnissii]
MMTVTQLTDYLDTLLQSEACYPFGPEFLVYKIRGKMFAYIAQDRAPMFVTLKCTPQDGEVLTSQFSSIRPGYHMNKRHWISVDLDGDVEAGMIEDLCQRSYQLVVSQLKKSDREALQSLTLQGAVR